MPPLAGISAALGRLWRPMPTNSDSSLFYLYAALNAYLVNLSKILQHQKMILFGRDSRECQGQSLGCPVEVKSEIV